MAKRTLIINGINLLTVFDFFVDTVSKSPPSKKESRQSVPQKSGSYNMYASLGYSIYEDRELSYTGQLVADNSEELDRMLTKLNNLLLTKNELTIQDTATPDYHYKMECTAVTPSNNERGFCDLTITFKGYPFKIWNDTIQNAKWDDINFEIDTLQPASYSVKKGVNVVVNNTTPAVISFSYTAGAEIQFTLDGITYAFTQGSHNSAVLLKPGNNTLKITSVGGSATATTTLSIDWKREEL